MAVLFTIIRCLLITFSIIYIYISVLNPCKNNLNIEKRLKVKIQNCNVVSMVIKWLRKTVCFYKHSNDNTWYAVPGISPS